MKLKLFYQFAFVIPNHVLLNAITIKVKSGLQKIIKSDRLDSVTGRNEPPAWLPSNIKMSIILAVLQKVLLSARKEKDYDPGTGEIQSIAQFDLEIISSKMTSKSHTKISIFGPLSHLD